MKIISISLDEQTLASLDELTKQGFAGRSEIMRKSVQKLIEEEKEHRKINGEIDAILLVKHSETHTEVLMTLRHAYQELIQTHLHTHLKDHRCLEIYVLKGPAEKIKKLAEQYQTSKKVESAKLIVS